MPKPKSVVGGKPPTPGTATGSTTGATPGTGNYNAISALANKYTLDWKYKKPNESALLTNAIIARVKEAARVKEVVRAEEVVPLQSPLRPRKVYQQLTTLQKYLENKNRTNNDILAFAIIDTPTLHVGSGAPRRKGKSGGGLVTRLKIFFKRFNKVEPAAPDAEPHSPRVPMVNNFVTPFGEDIADTIDITIDCNPSPPPRKPISPLLPWDVITKIYEASGDVVFKDNDSANVSINLPNYYMSAQDVLLTFRNALNITAHIRLLHRGYFENLPEQITPEIIPDNQEEIPREYKKINITMNDPIYTTMVENLQKEVEKILNGEYDINGHESKIQSLDWIDTPQSSYNYDTYVLYYFTSLVKKCSTSDLDRVNTLKKIFDIIDSFCGDMNFVEQYNGDWNFKKLYSLLYYLNEVGDKYNIDDIKSIDESLFDESLFDDLEFQRLLTDQYDDFLNEVSLTDETKKYINIHVFECAIIYAIACLFASKEYVLIFLKSDIYLYEKSLEQLCEKYSGIDGQLQSIQSIPFIKDLFYRDFTRVSLFRHQIKNKYKSNEMNTTTSLVIPSRSTLDDSSITIISESVQSLSEQLGELVPVERIKFMVNAYETMFHTIPDMLNKWVAKLKNDLTEKKLTVHSSFDDAIIVNLKDVYCRYEWYADRTPASEQSLSECSAMSIYVPEKHYDFVKNFFDAIEKEINDIINNVLYKGDVIVVPVFIKHYKVMPSLSLIKMPSSFIPKKYFKNILKLEPAYIVDADSVSKQASRADGGKLKKKQTCQYTKSDKRHELNGRKYIVYVGKRGGEYIKMKGEYTSLKSVRKSKKAKVPVKI
jgi:hypothetical protein